LNKAMPAWLSFIVWWELLFAALGIVLSFTLFLLSDFALNPFFLVPLCFVLVWLVSALGFNTQKRWAWNMGMATAILSLLLTPLFLGPLAIIFFIPWVVVWPGTIIYLTRPNVKRFLGKIKAPDTGEPDLSGPSHSK
jgi:hypothetical protein